MKAELRIISNDLDNGNITENEAQTLLLGLLSVNNCSQCGLEKENLICHSCAIENYGMGA